MADDIGNILGIQGVNDESVNDSANGNFSGNLSGNTATDNSNNSTNTAILVEDNSVENDAEESFNTDNSVDNDAEESFNTDNSVENDAEESFNTDDHSDNDQANADESFNTDNSVEIEDSYNDESEHYTDSFNTQTLNDNSATAGVRQYNTGFNDLNLGGLGGHGGGHGGGGLTLDLDNRSTVVDQSVNQNIWSGGGDVDQEIENEANVASGDGSVAAGEDADVDNSWTNIEVGDVSIGNTWNTATFTDSFNDYSTETENSIDVEIEDSFNEETENSIDVEVEDSFNNEWETDIDNDIEWENSGNFFSPDSTAIGEIEL